MRTAVRVAALVTLWPAGAAAQELYADAPGSAVIPELIPGSTFDLGITGVAGSIEDITFELGDYLELIEVRNGAGAVVWSPASCTDTTPPYDACMVDCPSCASGAIVAITTATTGTNQTVLLYETTGTAGFGWNTSFTLRVQLRRCATAPSAGPSVLIDATSDVTRTLDALAPRCAVDIDGLGFRPASPSAPRDVPAHVERIEVFGMIGAQEAPLRPQLFVPGTTSVDPARVDAFISCARVVPPGTPSYGTCGAAPFSDFSRVAIESTEPLVVQIEALNPADPVPGDAALRFSVEGSTYDLSVPVQRPAVSMTLAGAPATLGLGGLAQIDVATALNALGGNEPRVAQWSITPAAAAAWLDASDPTRARVQVPTDPGVVAAVPSVTVRAVHPFTGSTASAEVTIQLVPVAAQASRCDLVPAEARVPLAGRRTLSLLIETPAGLPLERPVDPVWSLEGPGALDVATDTRSAVYVAPDELGTAEVVVRFTPGVCPADEVRARMTIDQDVSVRLTSEKKKVEAGGVATLVAHLVNGSDVEVSDVTFLLTVDRSAKRLRRLPTGDGVTVLPASPATGGAAAAVPATRDSWFSTVLPPGGEQQLRLPILARTNSACGEITARIAAYRSGAPIAENTLVLPIPCDFEVTEATLFGKVFDDKNGDGDQQPGEPGVPGAVVALATGVWATTDAHGKYHIARLATGRHAVKVDLASLPMGAVPVGSVRREVLLTPGMFTKASFAVRLPRLDEGGRATLLAGSGVVLDGRALVFRARLAGIEGPLAARRGGQEVLAAREPDGTWVLALPIDGGAPHWLLTERRDDGRVYLSSFAIHPYDRAEGGTLVVPWGPRPLARFIAPPPGAVAAGDKLAVTGELLTPATITLRADDACTVAAAKPSPLRCSVAVSPATQDLAIALDAAPDEAGDDPPELVAELPISAGGQQHFLVGLAGVQLGAGLLRGEDGAEAWDAGGAFFYRGSAAGGLSLTAGADLRAHDVFVKQDGRFRAASGVAARLFGHDPTRIFRDLDPEAYAPTYGDGSKTVDEREAGGRLFVRVQKGQSYAKWGAVNTAIDDAEAGRYVRSLYGFGARLHAGDGEETPGVRAVLFAAQPDSVPARDELEVTGGTLYFLSSRDVVEGTVRVTLEVLDELSGLPVRDVLLTEGVDFEVDYAGGRIALDAVLPSNLFSGSITGAAAGGQRARLLVEYEHGGGAGLGRDWSSGARLVGRWHGLSLGLTGAAHLRTGDDDRITSDTSYQLLGATARFDLGDPLRLRLEVAQSTGSAHTMSRSLDGGLTFEAAAPAADAGSAAVLEAATKLGGVSAAAYARLFQRGFVDSHHAGDARLLQGGLRLEGQPLDGTKIFAQADHREHAPVDLRTERDTALAGVAQRLGDFRLQLEARHTNWRVENTRLRVAPQTDERTAAALQVGWQATPAWRLHVRRRQLLEPAYGDPGGETAAGVMYERGGAAGGLELGIDDDVEPFARLQGSVPVDDETALYVAYVTRSRLASELGDDASKGTTVVAGGRQALDDGTRLYAEEQLRADGPARGGGRRVGAELSLVAGTRLSLSYERGGRDELPGAPLFVRDGGAVGLAWGGGMGMLTLVADARHERTGSDRLFATGGQARGELYATPDITLALGVRGGSAWGLASGADDWRAERSAWEGAAGFAIRPLSDDRINAFGRYALVHERRELDGDQLRELTHLASFALAVDVAGPFGLTPKVAYRVTSVALRDGGGADDRALLGALRADVQVVDAWDVAVEGRVCTSPGSEDAAASGGLAEVGLLAMGWLRLGAGYNFSSIAASGVRCREPGAEGAFVRIEAIY